MDSTPESAPMLAVARNLRMERDRENKISEQRQDLKNSIVHGEQRKQRLQNQLRDIRHASVGATPEGKEPTDWLMIKLLHWLAK